VSVTPAGFVRSFLTLKQPPPRGLGDQMRNWRFIIKEACGFVGFVVIIFFLIWTN
jgi:hypothetical protein